MNNDVKTADNLKESQVAHMMNITDVKAGDRLIFIRDDYKQLRAVSYLIKNAVIGKVLSTPVKGFAGYYSMKTDLQKKDYQHHLNDLVAIVKDLLTPQQRKNVKSLVYTSADDCRVSLNFVTDMDVLTEALRLANEKGYKTKAGHIQRKINQLSKGK